MMIQERSVILSAVFVSDPIEFRCDAMIVAFTIPEKEAFILDRAYARHFEEVSVWEKDMQKAYRDTVLGCEGVFGRAPSWDLSEGSEATNRMFSEGFYNTDINGRFYGGMGITGFFMGLAEGEIARDQLVLSRGVCDSVWK